VRVFRVALAALKSASADLRGNSRQEFRSPQLLEVMNSFPVAAFRSNVSNVRVSCYAAHFSVFSLTQFLLATILRSGTSDNDKCFLGSASEGKAFFNVSNRDFRTTFTIIEESIKKLRPAVFNVFHIPYPSSSKVTRFTCHWRSFIENTKLTNSYSL